MAARHPGPTRVGQALQGKSMRPIMPEDFVAIVLNDLSETLDPANAIRLDLDLPAIDFPAPDRPGFAQDVDRRVEQMLVNRKIRDANFRLEVCRAYDDTCAVTGLKIVNVASSPPLSTLRRRGPHRRTTGGDGMVFTPTALA